MYQQPWSWIKSNLHAPLPAIAFVATVTAGVGTHNVFRAQKYDVYVEKTKPHLFAPDTTLCLPRVCIVKRDGFIETIYQHIAEKRT